MGTLLDLASLVVVPSGYKEDKIYSVVPTDGSGDLDFTRASSATRVNSAGLIEKVRTNLFNYSEDFSNAYWTKYSSTITTNTSETADPFGGNAADIIVSANATAGTGIEGDIPYTSGNEMTTSTYFKYKNTAFVQLRAPSFVSSDFVNFNIQTGTIVGGSYSLTPTITSVGNGWYRCSFTFVSNFTGRTAAVSGFLVDGASATRGQAFTGDGVKGVYIFGAQAETGDIATDYIPTTTTAVSVGMTADVPRLDYLGSSCPSLLLEPQRTNGHTFSENFDNAAWSKLNATISANAAVSPSGYQDADKLIDNSTSGTHVAFQVYSFASAAAHTISIFAKAAEITSINIFNNVVAGFDATFNLSNGTVTSVASGGTATITAYGNGWYRCAVTATASITSANTQFRLVKSGNTTYVGNGTDGAFIWGAQIEEGAYATSYIPTLGTSVTRVADAASKTGISSLIGQTEGTMFAEFDYNGSANSGQFERIIALGDGTSGNRIILIVNNTTAQLYAFIGSGGSSIINQIISGTNVLGHHKVAFAYKANDCAVYLDGVLVFSSTSAATIPATSVLYLGVNEITGTDSQLGGTIGQALLFKTRLTNAQLAQLTSL